MRQPRHLRASREQYETVTEELRASNEELQSINEELQTLNNELKLKLDAVSRAHNDLQNLMSATDVATLFLTTTMRINRFTPRVSDWFNVAPGDEGRPLSDLTHRLEYSDLLKDAQRVLTDLAPLERTIRSANGQWLLMRVRPYRTIDDKIDGVVVSFVDVTERQEAERKWESRQRLLLQELSHRIKNTFSVVGAIVSHTLRAANADAGLQQALTSRLQALSKSYDQLFDNDWTGADIVAIMHDQLDAYLGSRPARIELQGPAVHLPRDIAVPFGLLLHELATNASKYGSLSTVAGRVTLAWRVVESESGRQLRVEWRESGGPRIGSPAKMGFGSYLLEHGLPESIVERQFSPQGFTCTIEVPLTKAGRD